MAPIATADLDEQYYPVPFPKDVPTANLKKISLQKLLDGDEKEGKDLFTVLSNEGFFYLDLTPHELGRKFLDESNQLHHIAADVFNNVPMKEKLAFPPGDPTKDHLHTGLVRPICVTNGTILIILIATSVKV
jgi:hypothetical protein